MARKRQTVTAEKTRARRIAAKRKMVPTPVRRERRIVGRVRRRAVRRVRRRAVRRVRRTAGRRVRRRAIRLRRRAANVEAEAAAAVWVAAAQVAVARPRGKSPTPLRKRLASQRKLHLLVLLVPLIPLLVQLLVLLPVAKLLLLLLLLLLGIRRKGGGASLAERARMPEVAVNVTPKAARSGGPGTTEARAGRHLLLVASEGEGVDRPGNREGVAVPMARKGGGRDDVCFLFLCLRAAFLFFCNIHVSTW